MNDDAYAHSGLLAQHMAAHATRTRRVVAGAATWLAIEKPTLFDLLVQRTAMVFFPPPTDRPPTYRDCFGLNMSAPTDVARSLGGFHDIQNAYGYDDIELAHRFAVHGGAEIVHLPGARVTHDHRMTPLDLMRREYLLGRSAWAYAHVNAAFACDLFGRDLRDRSSIDHARAAIEHDRRDARRIERHFTALADLPPKAASDALLEALADSWLPLKRFLWRSGYVEAADADGRGVTGSNEPATELAALLHA